MKIVHFALRNMPRVQRTIRSETLKNALKNFIVAPLSEKYQICAFRCLWDVNPNDVPLVSFDILNKKEELEAKVSEFESVVLYFSCLCAMESSYLRKKLSKRMNEGAESDNDDYLDDVLIPGM